MQPRSIQPQSRVTLLAELFQERLHLGDLFRMFLREVVALLDILRETVDLDGLFIVSGLLMFFVPLLRSVAKVAGLRIPVPVPAEMPLPDTGGGVTLFLQASLRQSAALPPAENVPGASPAFRANPGIAIRATEAALRIDGKEIDTKPVNETDIKVTFTAEPTASSHQLSPVFKTATETKSVHII
jgi:hypothetical protein